MGIWKEVKCVHFDEEEQKWFVDAWMTADDWEEGKVIAKVDLKCNVEYNDERAKTDTYAQKIISDTRFDILAARVYEMYKKDWCDSRGHDIKDYDDENGFNGESFVCFGEFTNVEFRFEEYMRYLLNDEFTLWQDVMENSAGQGESN